MIDHVTYTVQELTPELDEFFALLGFNRMPVEDTPVEQAVEQYWYCNGCETDVHIVELTDQDWHWDHMCINSLSWDEYMGCLQSRWCQRARPGSRRIWLTGPGGIRVEVRKPDDK